MANKKAEDSRERLIGMGADALADVLLELGAQYSPVSKRIERLVETPEEKLKRVKAKIAGLKRAKRFVPRRESSEFAADLEGLLQDIRESVHDPKAGLFWVASFYQTDDAVIGRCDDSDGIIGDVYRIDARELFVEYGLAAEDKAAVADMIFRLNLEDGYGVRDALVDHAGQMLEEPEIRDLIRRFWKRLDEDISDIERRQAYLCIESLAKQIGDAVLFEQVSLMRVEKPYAKLWLEIAQVYLAAGDVDTALDRTSRIEDKHEPLVSQRNRLLLEIYRRKGWEQRRTELLERMFRESPSISLLDELTAAVGEDRRGALIEEMVVAINNLVGLDDSCLRFLMECGRREEAENYLAKRAAQIYGDDYYQWLPIAKEMEQTGFYTGATLIYRALLLAILEKANYNAYGHGARYLKKLDSLAEQIGDWKSAAEHRLFKEKIVAEHGRKSSFWAKYEGAK
ncbi:MAG: hypothetical protein PHP22_06550 [Oscillospiraceae bacterium]|nr:hypothetical protein [Oscillospiraceae bacterium]